MKKTICFLILFAWSFSCAVFVMGLEPMVILGQYIAEVNRTDTVRSLTRETIDSVVGWTHVEWSSSAQELLVSEERTHLVDVGALFHVVELIALAGLILFILMLLRFPPARHFRTCIMRARRMLSGGTSVFLGIIIIAAWFFDPVFDFIHLVLFPGQIWQFPPDAMILRLYPLAFWMYWGIGVWILALGILWFICLTLGNSKVRRLD